jgi:Uma2 family endonuclease
MNLYFGRFWSEGVKAYTDQSIVDSAGAAMPAVKRYTVDEYLAFERVSSVKHEYFDGEVFAMAGGSEPHNLLAMNVGGELRNALKDRPCRVYGSDMRVLCPTGLRTYPDVSVVCGTLQFENERRDTLLNPVVILEVLSPSTERYDRGKKFEHYRTISSLREYVLIAYDGMLVEHFSRQHDAQWLLTTYADPASAVRFSALDVTIPLSQFYTKVEFLPEPPPHEQNGDAS